MNKNPKGYIALVTVLIISAVVLATASTVSLLAVGEAQTSLALYKGEENLHFVEGCMEDALLKSWASSSYKGGNITRPEGTCIIGVIKKGSQWTITTTSTASAYNRTVQVVFNGTSGTGMSSWREVTIPTLLIGLVGYWKLDEGAGLTTADTSGNSNIGTMTNGPSWVTGKFGKALSFDGANDYVAVPDEDSLDLTEAMTISAWVKGNSFTDNSILSKDDYTDIEIRNYNFMISGTSGPYFIFCNTGVCYLIDSEYPLTTNTWYHVAVTYDRAFMRIYVNGVEVKNTAQTVAMEANTVPVSIGNVTRPSNNNYGHFNGIIDDVRVYNRALSAAEIQETYNGLP